ncbi:MAG: S8 family serine peptidase [Phycisphaeraceae bacterium]|nr:S8 family serine peptidase [Phycisphaerales bacterium]MCB9861049.1 S8 family serine peptidase [Phycisphaeraceae bacterium]
MRTGSAVVFSILAFAGSSGAAINLSHGSSSLPLLTSSNPHDSAPIAYWVFFLDKGIEPGPAMDAALAELEQTSNTRMIARRQLRRTAPGLFDERDLAVHQSYIDEVLTTGATQRITSKWLNAISVNATEDQIDAIAALAHVTKVQPVGVSVGVEPIEVNDHQLIIPTVDGTFYGNAEAQLDQINLITLHDAGHTAQGVIIGILDTGFKRTHDAFNQPGHVVNVLAEYDFVNDDPNTAPEPGDDPGQHNHGTYILGTIGSYLPNTMVGGAFDASFILCKTEDITNEYQQEEDFYVAGLEFIENNGGDMATSSLGYIDWYSQSNLNGVTAVTTIGVNIATANGMFCCTAAGNEGHDSNPSTSSLIAPADAFEVITCGAVRSNNAVVGFSSDGPTADGRVKPELMARGSNTWTVSPSNDSDLTQVSGTSLSTPLVAAAVACLIEAQPGWTVSEMRSMLFATAQPLGAAVPDPEFVWGYGIMNAFDAFDNDCNANGVPDATDITNGTSPDVNGNGIPDECEGLICYPDCDNSGTLNVFDYICFGNAYAVNDLYADCDGSGTLNVFDYICYGNAYATGCP